MLTMFGIGPHIIYRPYQLLLESMLAHLARGHGTKLALILHTTIYMNEELYLVLEVRFNKALQRVYLPVCIRYLVIPWQGHMRIHMHKAAVLYHP